ncbi:MAG: RNA polymerase sigma-70 factor [Bacteroidales bacterium]|nr:RNA polymerase sigma-70 factor [Bacteroidales bacterium]
MKDNEKQIQFNKFVADYQPRLSAYASHFVQDRQEVNDIVQTAFIKVWERYFENDSREWPNLIFTIIRNQCVNYLKKQKIHPQDSLELIQRGEEKLYYFDFGIENSPYVYQDLEKFMDKVLSSLTDRSREIFELSRFKHLKNREIADQLGISVSAVEKHISKALKAFEDALPSDASIQMLILLTCIYLG